MINHATVQPMNRPERSAHRAARSRCVSWPLYLLGVGVALAVLAACGAADDGHANAAKKASEPALVMGPDGSPVKYVEYKYVKGFDPDNPPATMDRDHDGSPDNLTDVNEDGINDSDELWDQLNKRFVPDPAKQRHMPKLTHQVALGHDNRVEYNSGIGCELPENPGSVVTITVTPSGNYSGEDKFGNEVTGLKFDVAITNRSPVSIPSSCVGGGGGFDLWSKGKDARAVSDEDAQIGVYGDEVVVEGSDQVQEPPIAPSETVHFTIAFFQIDDESSYTVTYGNSASGGDFTVGWTSS